MLMVLIHEGAIMNEKIKIGGKLSTMVKQNKTELQAILGCNSSEKEKSDIIYIR